MKVYIFLNSGIARKGFYKEHFYSSKENGDKIICVNGGYLIARSSDVHPHYVIGDLDSLKGDVIDQGLELIKYPEEKDFSDFELALQKASELKPETIYVYGALGGRKDHEIINILLLAYSNIRAVFIEEQIEIYNVIEKLNIHEKKGYICSLVSFGGPCLVKEMEGFKYILKEEFLEPSSRGLSNIIIDNEAYIHTGKGNLIVIVSRNIL